MIDAGMARAVVRRPCSRRTATLTWTRWACRARPITATTTPTTRARGAAGTCHKDRTVTEQRGRVPVSGVVHRSGDHPPAGTQVVQLGTGENLESVALPPEKRWH